MAPGEYDDPWREYVNKLFDHERELRFQQLNEHEQALKLTREEIDRRLTDMNQLREQINSERTNYFGRREHEMYTTAMDRRLDTEKTTLDAKLSGLSSKIYVGVGIVLT